MSEPFEEAGRDGTGIPPAPLEEGFIAVRAVANDDEGPHEREVVGKLKTPGKASDEQRATAVYRLMELTFGSLIVAYVLGFLSASGAALVVTEPSYVLHVELNDVAGSSVLVSSLRWAMALTRVLTLIAISLSFAFVTAGMYCHYHTGMLTMPTMALNRVHRDFLIALGVAIAFGISILFPPTFGVMIGISICAVAHRRHHGQVLRVVRGPRGDQPRPDHRPHPHGARATPLDSGGARRQVVRAHNG